ncbi:MAG: protein kinase [Planctomycetes bacterium]|nr:protein kinase [Planctomycetota bacterium]
MRIVTECPPADRLEQFALGRLDQTESDSLSGHVLECPHCAETVGRLSGGDTWAEALRESPRLAAELPCGPAVDRAIEQACRLSASDARLTADDTTPISPDTGRLGDQSSPSHHESAAEIAEMLSPPQRPDELGRLGNYRVLKLLDYGGMGAVFLAEDEQLERRVALKAMKPALAGSKEARQRFLREARAAASLRHDNIVTIHGVGEDRGTLWLAMELLEGESLKTRLERERQLPRAEAVHIALQIAEALAASHRRGLIHRDIKPANVWLETVTRSVSEGLHSSPLAPREEPSESHGLEAHATWHGLPARDRLITRSVIATRVKVLDFGLARAETDDAHLTTTGIAVGTPAYMAPEQARGDTIDHRCDLFSLGLVLFRMLTGRSAFRGNDTFAMLMSLATDTPPSVRDCAPGDPVAAELDEVVARLLAKNPDDRPQSAAEVARTLEAIEVHCAGLARLPSREGGASEYLLRADAAAADVAETAGLPQVEKPLSQIRRRRRPILAAVAAVCALVFVGIILTLRTPRGKVTVELGDGVKPDEVSVQVERNGQLKVADAKNGWTIDVREGRYKVQLAGTQDRFDIDDNTIAVSRNKETRVKVTLRPVPVAANYALQFGAEGSDVKPDRFDLDLSKPVTIEAFVVPFDFVERKQSRPILTAYPFQLALATSGKWRFIRVSASGVTPGEAEDPRAAVWGQYVHIAGVWTGAERVLGEGNELHLFVDGKRAAWHQLTEVPTVLPRQPVPIGSTNRGNPFPGVIDEVRISATLRYREDFTPQQRLDSDEHTLALYHFDEGQGKTAYDSSPNRRDGTITTAVWVKEVAPGNYAPYDAPDAAPSAASAPTDAKEDSAGSYRRAAEWVLSGGGNVSVQTVDGHVTSMGAIRNIQQLPTNDFKLVTVNLERLPHVLDSDLDQFAGVSLHSLILNYTSIGDAGLERLAKAKLQRLTLVGTKITDAGLAHLRDMTSLEELRVESTRVTDAGIEHIEKLVKLSNLGLSQRVSDVGLAHLRGLTSLQYLNLKQTAVTDAGLVHLHGLKKLVSVSLEGTKVTAAGVAGLRTALPNCKIEWDGNSTNDTK